MKISSNVKQQWDAATLCCSSCLTQASAMLKNSHSKWLILSSPVLILSPLLMTSSGAQILETSSKNSPLLGYLETISTLQCSYKVSGVLTKKQSALLTRRVVAQMKRQQLISPNETVTCTCTKCELIETDTQTIRFWTF